MKDVAQAVGVSVTTVSHALNGTRLVEESTKNKILRVVSELGYEPNILARSLKGKGTKTIGIILSDISETFFSEIVKSIQ
jgi:DNA-binding LacI/PurR family transcriptional regulator